LFLKPGDPNQVEDESFEYLVATFLVASRACARHLGTDEISVADVEEYMLECASEHVAIFDVLMGIRFLEVIQMMRDSEALEGEHGFQLFSRARNIMTLLFTVTNAYKYVRINMDERHRWAFASDLQRRIQELYSYSCLTRHNKLIWSDRLMEWFIKDVRSFEGKHL
jgi:hypothetical protein